MRVGVGMGMGMHMGMHMGMRTGVVGVTLGMRGGMGVRIRLSFLYCGCVGEAGAVAGLDGGADETLGDVVGGGVLDLGAGVFSAAGLGAFDFCTDGVAAVEAVVTGAGSIILTRSATRWPFSSW